MGGVGAASEQLGAVYVIAEIDESNQSEGNKHANSIESMSTDLDVV